VQLFVPSDASYSAAQASYAKHGMIAIEQIDNSSRAYHVLALRSDGRHTSGEWAEGKLYK